MLSSLRGVREAGLGQSLGVPCPRAPRPYLTTTPHCMCRVMKWEPVLPLDSQ